MHYEIKCDGSRNLTGWKLAEIKYKLLHAE